MSVNHFRLRLPRHFLIALISICLGISLGGCPSNNVTNPAVPNPNTSADAGGATDPTTSTPPIDSGAPTSGLKIISAGAGHNCAIKNNGGSLWCWGQNDSHQLGDLSTVKASSPKLISNETWLTVSTGNDHNCGIKEADSSLWCWGKNDSSQLGNGLTDSPNSLTLISSDSIWTGASVGADHSCAIKNDNSLWCWGNNTRGQVGIDTAGVSVSTPNQIVSDSWNTISLGNQFSCGIKTDNTLWCWGDNSNGQLGLDPVTTNYSSPMQESTAAANWKAITTGDSHSCAIKLDQTLYCWGSNSYGQLGLGNTNGLHTPSLVETTPAAGDKWLSAAAGGNHSCAIRDDNTLWCWGDNSTGQLGLGNTAHQPIPIQVSHPNGKNWLLVATGNDHTCAIDSDYLGHCWGLNETSQLGNGISFDTTNPPNFNKSTNWTEIDSGTQHSCGLKTNPDSPTLNTLWCGGGNNFGQLGIGSTANQAAPVQIKGPAGDLESWNYLSTGHHYSCAITSAGVLYCWGRNSHHQLGKGGSDNINNVAANWSLAKITVGADDWIKISAGASHTCGIKNTDELWCWGDNATGQIGNGSSGAGLRVDAPTQISGAWLDVGAGGYIDATHTEGGHTCAIKDEGGGNQTLWCWGENDLHQLGDGSTTNTSTPLQIGIASDWVSVSAGKQHSCALKTDNKLYCWGKLDRGPAGTGTVDPITPTAVDGDRQWNSYALGQDFTCAITLANELWCWGEASNGQIPAYANKTDFSNIPVMASPNADWTDIALGQNHGCGIREDDLGNRRTYCWGTGAAYQFGNNSFWKTTPQPLSLQ